MSPSPWPAIGGALGLQYPGVDPHAATDPRHARGSRQTLLVGKWGPLWTEVGIRNFNYGSGAAGRRSEQNTFARARLPRPLDLGLDYSSQKGLRAGDAEVARALLSVPYVAEALAVRRASFLEVDDEWVRCESKGRITTPATLALMLDIAVDLARRLDGARAELGPSPTQRAMEGAWAPVAERYGMLLDVASTTMRGRYREMPVEVKASTTRRGRKTSFGVWFEPPLGVALQMRRQHGSTFVSGLLGAQDIEVGDPMFDDRFVIEGRPEAAVRALLGPHVRAALVRLQDQAARLTVDDDHLTAVVDWLVAEPAWLESGLQSVTGAAAALMAARRAM